MKQTVTSIYTREQFESYKKRLAIAIMDGGIDCQAVVDHTDYKDFIANYVEKEVIAKKHELALKGIVMKLANTQIATTLEAKIYPVINEYKGHDLTATIIFKLDKDHKITTRRVPMLDTPIILS